MCCLDCRYVERPLFQYCEMDTDSAYIAHAVAPSTTSSGQIVGSTTSASDPNGFRPNAATSTKTTTSTRLVSPDSRGQPPRRVAARARRTTRGRLVYLRSSGVATGSRRTFRKCCAHLLLSEARSASGRTQNGPIGRVKTRPLSSSARRQLTRPDCACRAPVGYFTPLCFGFEWIG